MTQIRGAANSFPTVERLIALAAEVRSLVGPDTNISYAADWSEYFGFQPQDSTQDRYFHLDALWADVNIDFIGIDNYMPLSDWREGQDHLDATFDDIYDLEYLKGNIEGGEGYDWYYHSIDAQTAQIRTPITDGSGAEPWIYRYKDIRNFWGLVHHERVNGVRSLTPTAWEPRSKPIWFTEIGCAAVDKGTNEPNKFLDQKSSESSLPKYSTGARDDLIQKQYLRAIASYWNDPQNNPVSDLYEGRMINMKRAFVWAWDTRPYPFFPNNLSLWSDGENYSRGHWINGRTSSRSLASVVGEICDRAGLEHYDTSGLYGYVRGYVNTQIGEARASLQPLMLRYAFDAIERNGVLNFVMRDGHDAMALDTDYLALSEDLDATLEQSREAEAELAGRVRLKFVQADANFENVSEEAILAQDQTHAVSSSQIPMSLTRAEGRQVSERWLTESRLARDTVRLALPMSKIAVGAGDVVKLPAEGTEGSALYRVDRVEHGLSQLIEGVRIDPSIYVPSEIAEDLARVEDFVPPVPVVPLFLDLPLIKGDETPHAPYIAATGVTWPGEVAVYQSSTDEDYVLNTILNARSVIGLTENSLGAGCGAIFDHGAPLNVKLTFGGLSAISQNALLSGGNLAAIGNGSTGQWEVFQFQDAQIVAPGTYALSTRLRGQLGSDGLMPSEWPVGSWFVLLNGLPQQIDLAANLRNVAQNFLIGPARRSYDDPSYIKQTHTFVGNGLRPYAPVHLRADTSGVDHGFSWIRRTRFDGDDWELPEVPLNEESESYVVRVSVAGETLREEVVSSPQWAYSDSDRVGDGVGGLYTVEVAQISARYGAGLAGTITVL